MMTTAGLKFSANISMLFCELPFLDRIDAARAAGFTAVECHFPYDLDREEVRARLAANGLPMTGLNTAPGKAGEFGLAAIPGREDDFRRAMDQALEWAVAIGASTIHVMAGCPAPQDRAWALETYLQNLDAACAMAKGAGVVLLIEPINTRDRPGYFLSRSDEAAEIILELRAPQLKMMFDLYHVQIMEGDLLRRLERWRDGHHRDLVRRARRDPRRNQEDEDAHREAFRRERRAGLRARSEHRPVHHRRGHQVRHDVGW
jgi:hydroxypyruvate isomerase